MTGVPVETYVSRIEPSHHDTSTFYVTYDNHRRGDFTPYVVASRNFGSTFTSLAGTLPTGGPDFVHVIREDPVNPDLLFLGTDVGAFVSMNRGASWQKFMTGLPTVPVHDLQIHPRDHELIAGTHGRAIYVVDIGALQQMTPMVAAKATHLFAPRIAYALGEAPDASGSAGGGNGHKRFVANSPAEGAEITYRIAKAQSDARVQVLITNAAGDTLRTLSGPSTVGVHRVLWDMRGRRPAAKPLTPSERRDSVKTIARTVAMLDSLLAAGQDSGAVRMARERVLAGRASELVTAGFGGRGGAGAGQQPGIPAFFERPGEGALPTVATRDTAAASRGARGAAGAPSVAAGAPSMAAGAPGGAAMQTLLGAFRGAEGTAFSRSGFGGGGGAPLVQTGDYLVTLIHGDQRQVQVLRVERAANVSGAQGFGVEDDDEPEDDGRPR